MKCPNCGQEVGEGVRFCPECGQRLMGFTPEERQKYIEELKASEEERGAKRWEGEAAVPPESRGWNWGAFLLCPIWGVCNRVWISLVSLVPYAGLIVAIVVGIKGNEWAWKKKGWEGIEHFKRTQRSWAKWGIGVTVRYIIIIVILMTLGYY